MVNPKQFKYCLSTFTEKKGGEKVREGANNTFPERMLMMTMVGFKQLSVAGVEVVVF